LNSSTLWLVQKIPSRAPKNEIKYGFKALGRRINFPYRNFSKFEMKFELKFREVSMGKT
jgi:hypothetical protein